MIRFKDNPKVGDIVRLTRVSDVDYPITVTGKVIHVRDSDHAPSEYMGLDGWAIAFYANTWNLEVVERYVDKRVEAAAEAIKDARWQESPMAPSWEHVSETTREWYRRQARAALAAADAIGDDT